jgi:hypothetical protein
LRQTQVKPADTEIFEHSFDFKPLTKSVQSPDPDGERSVHPRFDPALRPRVIAQWSSVRGTVVVHLHSTSTMVYLCDGVPQRLPFLAVVAQAVVIMPVIVALKYSRVPIGYCPRPWVTVGPTKI